jgi:hypothetical protein
VKVGDLVNNTHALDRSGLGLIVEVDEARLREAGQERARCYRIKWINPPYGGYEFSWNSAAWLEKIE